MIRSIGIFDSGIGGLGIARSIHQLLPNEQLVYLADSKNCPYGTKSTEAIIQLALDCANYLITEQKAKMVVVACNTATVEAIQTLRATYPEIPFIGVVPVIKTAVEQSKTGKIMVLSTPVTIKNLAYRNLLKQFASNVTAYSVPCPGLAEAIEAQQSDEVITNLLEEAIKKYIQSYAQGHMTKAAMVDFDTVVLGCTHYTLIEPIIRQVVGGKLLLDSNDAVARHVRRVLSQEDLLENNPGQVAIKTTGPIENIQMICGEIFPGSQVEPVNLTKNSE